MEDSISIDAKVLPLWDSESVVLCQAQHFRIKNRSSWACRRMVRQAHHQRLLLF